MYNDKFDKLNIDQENIHTKKNFFLLDESPSITNINETTLDNSRRLNDYDYNLLEADAYKEINNDSLKLEYKLGLIEDEIKSIDKQINLAKDINEDILIENLILRKNVLEENHKNLLAKYKEKSFSAKILDRFGGIFKNRFQQNSLNKYFSFLLNIIKNNLPKQLYSLLELRNSLNTLENLNKSVDDLMSMKMPYGENYNKYEQLSKYIIKANSIQTNISRHYKK